MKDDSNKKEPSLDEGIVESIRLPELQQTGSASPAAVEDKGDSTASPSKSPSFTDDAARSTAPSPFAPTPGQAGVGETKRKLTSRHITMIGLGSGIGTGLFVGSATALSDAGPVGVLLAYIIVAMIIVGIMEALAEMASLFPVAGSFMHFSSRFIDPSVGFAQGWGYFYSYAIGIASELSAASTVIEFWNDDINLAVWISIMMVVIAVVNLVGVNVYGETEVATSIIKVLAFVGFIIFGFVIDLGGGPTHDRLGFRYWINPGAFNHFQDIAGSLGRFLAFFSAFINSSYTYVGTETVVLTAGEATNPSKQIPKAAKRVVWRIIVFYILGIFFVGLLVPFDDERLSNGATYSASSPFVIAMQRAQVNVLPHIMNAIILVSALSAGSSYVYVSSRTLYALALDRQAPAFFRKIDERGVPVFAVIFSWLFGAFAYLSVGNGGGTAFNWLVALSTVSGLFSWAVISASYIRFRRAVTVQGYDRTVFPYRARWQPYSSWFSVIMCSIIIFFSGWSTFLGGFDVTSFLTNYIGIPLFFLPWMGWKWYKKVKLIPLKDMDLDSGRFNLTEEIPEPEPTTRWGKILAWAF